MLKNRLEPLIGVGNLRGLVGAPVILGMFMKSNRQWCAISTSLQLGEICAEVMPRLLFECIQDLNVLQGRFSGLVCDIESVITKIGEQVEEQKKGDNNEHCNRLEQREHEL